jgi:hypothetical protein
MIYTKSVIDDLSNMDRNTARAIIEDMTDYGYDERGNWHAPKPVRPLWHYIALGVAVTAPIWICAVWAIVQFFWGK